MRLNSNLYTEISILNYPEFIWYHVIFGDFSFCFKVRNAITHKDRIVIHMATDLEKLSAQIDPLAPWLTFMSDEETSKERL